jgi:phosphatidylserine/phosphatidylglycerophosphate/cardiolipin synthase-like enzyme
MRTAIVRHNTESTYVVPGDWPSLDGDSWYRDHTPPPAGSTVEDLIDGRETFDAMLAAMRTATTKGHFIVLLGWGLEHDFKFAGGLTFVEAVAERAKLGVAVRVLVFQADQAVIAINGVREDAAKAGVSPPLDVFANTDNNTRLPIGAGEGAVMKRLLKQFAISAHQPRSLGSHHHKILVVYGDDGLIAFCGGVDLAGNRLGLLHDVHVRLTGHAAKELWELVKQRWTDAKFDGTPPTPPSLAPLEPPPLTPPKDGTNLVRIFQTVGNPDTYARGVKDTLWPALRAAIRTASNFIYMEDQYFWSLDLVKELVDASKRLKHITILLSVDHVVEAPARRHRAMKELVRLGGKDIQKRIGIFEHKREKDEWIHAKMFVFDDEYAIVGSANANNRGYFVDSEVSAGIAEYGWNKPMGRRRGNWFATDINLARRLRIRLWNEHLLLPPDELFDGIGSRIHWESPPAGAPVSSYQSTNLKDFARQSDAHARAFEDWKAGGYKGPAPQEPYQRAPWWLAPYDDWYEPIFGDPRSVPVKELRKQQRGEPLSPEEKETIERFKQRASDSVRDQDEYDVVDPHDPEKQKE